MIKYIHGSGDSIDKDVYCLFQEMPSYQECQKICSEDLEENRNIIVITEGVVTDCFKGTPDEINNGLIRTYSLHPQEYRLMVEREVKMDLLIKSIRVLRCFLSHCSRTEHRSLVKQALTSYSWLLRLEALNDIDLAKIKNYGKNRSKKDIYKTFAFQLGQVLALIKGKELYTKREVATFFPDFKPFLYRVDDVDVSVLQGHKNKFYNFLNFFKTDQKGNFVYFPTFDKLMDVKNECYK